MAAAGHFEVCRQVTENLAGGSVNRQKRLALQAAERCLGRGSWQVGRCSLFVASLERAARHATALQDTGVFRIMYCTTTTYAARATRSRFTNPLTFASKLAPTGEAILAYIREQARSHRRGDPYLHSRASSLPQARRSLCGPGDPVAAYAYLVRLAQQFQQHDHALVAVLLCEHSLHAGERPVHQFDLFPCLKQGAVILMQT
jgi:hypothetical protein